MNQQLKSLIQSSYIHGQTTFLRQDTCRLTIISACSNRCGGVKVVWPRETRPDHVGPTVQD